MLFSSEDVKHELVIFLIRRRRCVTFLGSVQFFISTTVKIIVDVIFVANLLCLLSIFLVPFLKIMLRLWFRLINLLV